MATKKKENVEVTNVTEEVVEVVEAADTDVVEEVNELRNLFLREQAIGARHTRALFQQDQDLQLQARFSVRRQYQTQSTAITMKIVTTTQIQLWIASLKKSNVTTVT